MTAAVRDGSATGAAADGSARTVGDASVSTVGTAGEGLTATTEDGAAAATGLCKICRHRKTRSSFSGMYRSSGRKISLLSRHFFYRKVAEGLAINFMDLGKITVVGRGKGSKNSPRKNSKNRPTLLSLAYLIKINT